ncbi:hypothetical protein QF040_004503 [Variovorax sp. W2I14]
MLIHGFLIGIKTPIRASGETSAFDRQIPKSL